MLINPNFIYFGTSDFSATILSGLISNGLIPELVVTTIGKPQGRKLQIIPTPVAEVASKHQLKLLEVKTLRDENVIKQFAICHLPFAILASFGKIIPQTVLDIFPQGIVNVHPSLLPLYRGPSPIQSAILDGQTTTGVSLILLDAEVDHGPILTQTEHHISSNDDVITLSNKLAEQSVKMLVDTLPKYLSGELKPIPQNHSTATFTKMISKDDGQADFINKTAEELNNQRRAFTPWPGLWTIWQGKRLKLLSTTPHNDVTTKPGLVTLVEDSLVIGTKSGALEINELQLEGGKPLKTKDFLLGHKSFINSLL